MCLSLESLFLIPSFNLDPASPSPSQPSDFDSSSSSRTGKYFDEDRGLDVELGDGEKEEQQERQKVFICWEWKTVRVGGFCTFCWGTNFEVRGADGGSAENGRGSGSRNSKGRACFLKRVVWKVGRRGWGRNECAYGRGLGSETRSGKKMWEPEQELKPLLF